MRTTEAIMTILDRQIQKSSNPFLKSYKCLPMYVLDRIVDKMIRNSKEVLTEDALTVTYSIKGMTADIEKEFIREVLQDDVGLLIRYGASRNTITEITGATGSKIKDRRKMMPGIHFHIGRPRIITDDELDIIKQMWLHYGSYSAPMKVVSIHIRTNISLDDVWAVVNKIPLESIQRTDVSKCD